MQVEKIKKHIFLTAALLAGLLVCTDMNAQSSRIWVHQPARDLIRKEKLEIEVGFLSDSICAGRATGTAGNAEAAAWIARKFRKAGLLQIDSTWSQSFRTENGTVGRNILGFLPGSSRNHPDKYIIVGAHYDHIGTIHSRLYPGADSNASGVVTMASLAEMAAMTISMGRTYSHNIIFVAFDGKEMSMAGSNRMWEAVKNKELTDPVSGKAITRDRIKLMVNIDQIGCTLSPLSKGREDYIIMLDGTSRQTQAENLLKSCNSWYDIDFELGFSYYGSENFTKLFYRLSDQKAFAENGIPAVMFTSGITMNNNKTWDTVSTLNMDIFIKRIYLIYHWLIMTI